jgi:hypothetical protein
LEDKWAFSRALWTAEPWMADSLMAWGNLRRWRVMNSSGPPYSSSSQVLRWVGLRR